MTALSVNEINMLQSQNEGFREQNRILQQKFLKILSMCDEPADNMQVLNFQKRIKEVLK